MMPAPGVLGWAQAIVWSRVRTLWLDEFDLLLILQCGSTCNCVSRSVNEVHNICCRVSARAGWPCVRTLWQDDTASSICNVFFSVVVHAMIMIMMGLKGAIREFYNLITSPRTISSMYAEVARARSWANHLQHIERLPRATWYEGTTQLLSLTEFKSYWF